MQSLSVRFLFFHFGHHCFCSCFLFYLLLHLHKRQNRSLCCSADSINVFFTSIFYHRHIFFFNFVRSSGHKTNLFAEFAGSLVGWRIVQFSVETRTAVELIVAAHIPAKRNTASKFAAYWAAFCFVKRFILIPYTQICIFGLDIFFVNLSSSKIIIRIKLVVI